MQYFETAPIQSLKTFVHCIWTLDATETSLDHESAEPVLQRVLPDGRPEFVIHFGDQCRRMNSQTGEAELQSRSLMIGASKSSVLLRPGKRTGMIGVRFKPSGAMRFLKASMKDFSDQIVSLHDWSPHCAAEVEEKILEASSNAERVEILQDFLVHQLMDGRPDLALSRMITEIKQAEGKIEFKQLYSTFNISERQAERKFLAGVGLSPKVFARVVRFQKVIQNLNRFPTIDLTELAMNHGYYDQSHFIKEFKAFSGISPKAYLAENHLVSDCFTAS